MKYLVIGGSGYIGQNMIPDLIQSGKDVINIDMNPLGLCVKSLRVDLSIRDKVTDLFNSLPRDSEYDVIHLAGFFEKDVSRRDSYTRDDFFRANLTTVENVIDAIRKSGISLGSFSFSSAALVNCLGKVGGDYPEAKRQAEEIIKESIGFLNNVNIFRISRVVGGMDRGMIPKDIISDFMIKIRDDEQPVIGGADISRDYVHVSDVSRILSEVRKSGFSSMNLYSSEQISIGNIAKIVSSTFSDNGIAREKKIELRNAGEHPLKRLEGETAFSGILGFGTSEEAVRKTAEEYVQAFRNGAQFR